MSPSPSADHPSPPESDPHDASPSGASTLNPNLKQRLTSPPAHPQSMDDYAQAILEGNRAILSQAITLTESTRPDDQERAHQLLDACLPHTGNSVRVAITGVPGVGKSTFIETLGTRLVDTGRRLAVLTVDPTSERTKGSILGDKTRMGRLAGRDDVFIRPSPTGGALGGVARKTRETILLCEAAGFDIVFVETVGVGQSEVTVHSMVDCFLLLALAGAGDELQGIKRGIVEMADAIVINKADGENRQAAEKARSAYQQALRLFPTDDSGWTPPVLTCSARTGDGIDAVWQAATDYVTHTKANGYFTAQRRRQARFWLHQTIEDRLREAFFAADVVQSILPELEAKVEAGMLSAAAAADELLRRYRGDPNSTS